MSWSMHALLILQRTLLLLVVLTAACSTADPVELKQDNVRRGDALFANEQFAQAIVAYRDALEHDPQDGELRLKLVEALKRAGLWGEVPLEAVRAADLLPRSQDAQVAAAESLVTQGRFIDAIDRASLVLKANPDNARALVVVANARARVLTATWALERLEEALRLKRDIDSRRTDIRSRPLPADDIAAVELYRRAAELEPQSAWWMRQGLIGLLWTMGRDDEGAAILKELADQIPSNAFLSRALGVYYVHKNQVADAEKYLRIAATTGDPESRLALADLLAKDGRSDAAIAIFQEMATGDRFIDVTLRVADIELQRNRFDEAKRATDLVMAREPWNPRALRIRAQLIVRSKTESLETGLAAAQAAVRADPMASEPRLLLGQVLTAKGQHESAFDEFVEATRRDPTSAEAARELVRTALLLNRITVALEFARQRARTAPSDPSAAADLVTVLVRGKEYGEAERILGPLLAANATSPVLLTQRGEIDAARGNQSAARASFERALRVDPDSFEALSGLVGLDLEGGRIAAARERMDLVISRHPKDPGYLLLAARAAIASGDGPRSESTLKQVLALDPSSVVAAELLAREFTARKRGPEAILVLERVLMHRPLSRQARLALGETFESLGRVSDAQAVYERLLDDAADSGVALARLAAIHLAQGTNLDVALSVAVEAKQQLPNDPGVNDTLGWIYVRKGLPRRGIALLEAAVQAAPSNPLYRYHAGMTYIDLGDTRRARTELEGALRLDPAFPGADRARTALRELPR